MPTRDYIDEELGRLEREMSELRRRLDTRPDPASREPAEG
jgi:hypothetical protein